MTQRKAGPLWGAARWPLAVGMVCLVGGGIVLRLDEKTPYNCDFSCAMSSIGWQDQLAFLMFALVCVLFGVLSVVDFVRDRWR
ncbi:EscU/YscU/HrcU family type III secretion system export apparatus switch protein [Actinomadura bangladeshensis]|uniref:EscU/YscU/HrcU family type III secretion system export apparatus switch protein n=1 Tax=Actinomadura bangladeshensis TaxID=453573 RepID=A0A6L9QNU2_9ACTN|nr:EscU/YscU/HrcU family type III secretion system export apparatus switch protein [Actinomadura bangladeshensis]NEA27127.1 EscU/YscU/HrcU family type III secretion system export apparatus switch protein [Actinomadura bangladeshensis]